MKRSTRWIIGVCTAIITVAGLNAAFGSRIHSGRYFNRHCYHAHGNAVDSRLQPEAIPTK